MTMNELQALARAVEAERPPIPPEVLRAQRQRLLADPRARVRARHRKPGVAATGVLALSLAAAWVFSVRGDSVPGDPSEASARRSVSEPVSSERRLQDGTWIRLDAGALGHLAQGGPQDVRFELDRGRAEFDVTPDPARMFRVLAGDYEVRVLGTRFSVDYDPAGHLAVSVTRGMVSVASSSRAPLRLEAGGRLSVAEGRWLLESAGEALSAGADAGSSRALTPAARASSPRDEKNARTLRRSRAASTDWRRLYLAGDYAGALRAARAEGLESLALRLDAAALADLADSARLGGDPSAALQLLAALERRFPASEWASRASFLSGRLLEREGHHAEAVASYERQLARDPDGTYAGEARGRLMQAYVAIGERGRARAQAEVYLARYPDGPYRFLASGLIAGQ